MKLAVASSVLSFPSPKGEMKLAGSAGLAMKAQHDAQDQELRGDFLAALNASIESAEEVIVATEEAGDQAETEGQSAGTYDAFLDYAFFGSLLERVEAKYQFTMTAPANGPALVAGPPAEAGTELESDSQTNVIVAEFGAAKAKNPGATPALPQTQTNLIIPLPSGGGQLRKDTVGFEAAVSNAKALQKKDDTWLAATASNVIPSPGLSMAPALDALPADSKLGSTGVRQAARKERERGEGEGLSPANNREVQPSRRASVESIADRALNSSNFSGRDEPYQATGPGQQAGSANPWLSNWFSGSAQFDAGSQISQAVTDILGSHVRAAIANGEPLNRSFRFSLRPDELGGVGVSLTLQGSKLQLHLHPEVAAAAEALKRDQDELEASLSALEVGVESVEVVIQMAAPDRSSNADQPKASPENNGAAAQGFNGQHDRQQAQERHSTGKNSMGRPHHEASQHIQTNLQTGAGGGRSGIYL